jgi:hypothetical protein
VILAIEHYLTIIGSIVIPIIVVIYKKRPRKKLPIQNSEIEKIKEDLKRLEDQVEKDHITIDNLRGKVAFIEGRLSK